MECTGRFSPGVQRMHLWRAPVRCGFLMWGMWLCTAVFVFSVMSTLPHTAYLAILASPVAALGAAGICMFVHLYRAGRPSGWLLPAAIVAEVLWADFLWRDYRGFLPWALSAALATGALATVILVAARLVSRFPRRAADASVALGLAAMLAAPAAWTASVPAAAYGNPPDDFGGVLGGPALYECLPCLPRSSRSTFRENTLGVFSRL